MGQHGEPRGSEVDLCPCAADYNFQCVCNEAERNQHQKTRLRELRSQLEATQKQLKIAHDRLNRCANCDALAMVDRARELTPKLLDAAIACGDDGERTFWCEQVRAMHNILGGTL